ncbi:hypothetical protein E2C01_024950 [Portunus trituberculatus]|uniref:Uncharacterized protein n=1 Tax=Portunus trituberculatus TaxID=210409 RepID=A0A5B7EGJ9_PORTR|nr:hypothetical protein [Portunus trituberculatus]
MYKWREARDVAMATVCAAVNKQTTARNVPQCACSAYHQQEGFQREAEQSSDCLHKNRQHN